MCSNHRLRRKIALRSSTRLAQTPEPARTAGVRRNEVGRRQLRRSAPGEEFPQGLRSAPGSGLRTEPEKRNPRRVRNLFRAKLLPRVEWRHRHRWIQCQCVLQQLAGWSAARVSASERLPAKLRAPAVYQFGLPEWT